MRNIVILAHVDAGKTTLSEQLLSTAGAIRTVGKVDTGTAHTDRLPIEKRRGISVQSAGAVLRWENEEITLIDTPGHSDFCAETERALSAPDGAVLVMSAVEGVQSRTEALFDALKKAHIPTLLFINKQDREGADRDRVLGDVKSFLTENAVPLWDEEALYAFLAERDDQLMEQYLMGESASPEQLKQALIRATHGCEAYPALSGSALKGEGVKELLSAIVDFLPPPSEDKGALAARVFAVTKDEKWGRCAHVRVFSGALRTRDAIMVDGKEQKITQLRRYTPDGRGEDTPELKAGQIGMVMGWENVRPGMALGDEALLPRPVDESVLSAPTLQVSAAADKGREHALYHAFLELEEEDPLLQVGYDSVRGETVVSVMGDIQLEILTDTLASRFGLNVTFGEPRILYKETVIAPVEGYVAYLAPKPCWAIIQVRIEPLPRGSGVAFSCPLTPKDLPIRYQRQIENALPLALRQGVFGYELTDVKITILYGEHHEIHTHPLDFIVALPMAVMDALDKGHNARLEPVMQVDFMLPGEHLGRVMSDVEKMRGEVQAVSRTEDERRARMHCLIPMAEMLHYSETLRRLTGGKGGMTLRLHGYQNAPDSCTEICPRRSVDPRDTSKYILAARSALEGGIFDR